MITRWAAAKSRDNPLSVFGTTLSPLLILLGYSPLEVVPAILFSELISGFVGGGTHVYFGNVNWKVTGFIAGFGAFSMIAASYFASQVIPKFYIKLYVAIIVLAISLIVVVKSFKKFKRDTPRKWKTALLGMLTSWNKGITGGGFGPIATNGLILLGLHPSKAIGTTTISEGIICFIGLIAYQRFIGLNWTLALLLTLGSIIADVPSAWLTNKMKRKFPLRYHGRLIGVFMLTLGVATLYKTLRA